VLYAFVEMKNRNASGAKYLGLFCVPLIPLVALAALPALQRHRAHAATERLFYQVRGFDSLRDQRIPVEQLVARGANVHARDKDGRPLIHWAVWNEPNTAKELIRHGANIDAADKDGITPLIAAIQGPLAQDTVKFILDQGANVNGAKSSNSTPLQAAVMNANPDAVRLLLSRGANPTLRECNPCNPPALLWARQAVSQPVDGRDKANRSRYIEIIKMLKAAGAKEQPSSTCDDACK
jgi:ankyrin repeat protein